MHSPRTNVTDPTGHTAHAILLNSGTYFDALNTTPEAVAHVTWRDVAKGLAGQARWRGQTVDPHPVTVGAHSLAVATAVTRFLFDGTAQEYSDAHRYDLIRAALLHDASEAFLGDVPTPHKRHPVYAPFVEAERALQRALNTRFGLEPDAHEHPLIHTADKAAAVYEARRFHNIDPITACGWDLPEWWCDNLDRVFGEPGEYRHTDPRALVKELEDRGDFLGFNRTRNP